MSKSWGSKSSQIMKISIHVSSFLILFLYSLSIVQISSAIDTINTTDIIRDGDTIVSSAERFELGFFSPGNTTNRYVGIWYKKITGQTVIWVANRESPLRRNSTSSGVFTVNRSGQLVIRDDSNSTIWSSNTSRVARNPIAQLLGSGNLVIREANDDRPENYLWQSFDYPTDTFLPGMDFGWNHATGLENYLLSWRTNEDPAPGDFTLGFEMTGYPQLVIKRGGDVVYRLGPWNVISFSMRGDPIVIVGSFRNNNNSVIYYRDEATDKSVFSRFTLAPIGIGQRWTWIDRSQEWVYSFIFPAGICDNYGSCGAHGLCNTDQHPPCVCLAKFVPQDEQDWATSNWLGGCVRRTALNCRDDVFLRYSGFKMPDSRDTWFDGSLSVKECEAVCLRNCSCTAYTNMSGCLLWFGELVDMRVLPGAPQEIFIRLASSELDSNRMKRTTLIAILTSLAGILLIGLSVALFVLKRKINDQKLRKEGMQI